MKKWTFLSDEEDSDWISKLLLFTEMNWRMRDLASIGGLLFALVTGTGGSCCRRPSGGDDGGRPLM